MSTLARVSGQAQAHGREIKVSTPGAQAYCSDLLARGFGLQEKSQNQKEARGQTKEFERAGFFWRTLVVEAGYQPSLGRSGRSLGS